VYPSFGDDLASCELFDPRNTSWRTVAPMIRPRGYHHTALLLPDGSVFVGGDQGEGSDPNETTAEIYYPWYFTAPSRPSLTSAPAQAAYGEEITLGTPNTNISRVVLIRAGSTTHGLNTDQRAVELSFRAGTGSVIATTPATPNAAPPGYYMVFLVNSSNVPSASRFVRLSGTAATLPSVTVSASDANAAEAGTDPGTFTVTRTGPTTAALTVGFTLGGTASAADYAAVPGTVTIPAGSPSAPVTLTPVDDTTVEGSETVVLTLSGGQGYTVGAPSSATVTIADNDTAPANQPPQVAITRPASGAVFTSPVDITIEATATDDGAVQSVEFFAGGQSLGTDTTAPYTTPWVNVPVGTHNLTARATDTLGASTTSAPVTITVNGPGPTPAPTVTGLTLIDADLDQPIAGFDPLLDGATIDLGTLPTRNLNIRANTNPATVGSVRFGYDAVAAYRTENAAPYALEGDNAGDYAPWTPATGAHSVTATPYTMANAGGTAGPATVVTFTVIDTPAPPPPPPPPPPAPTSRRSGENENGDAWVNDRCAGGAIGAAGPGAGLLAVGLAALLLRRRRRA
jgi:hypothetical protein